MPPARRSRSSTGPAPRGAQKTLSFGTKVTKAVPLGKDLDGERAAPSPLGRTVSVPVAESEVRPGLDIDTRHVSSAAAVAQQARVELQRDKSAAEEQAEKVSETQIQRYWRAREDERMTKRVHQEDLGVEEKILRLFDMSSQYGPAIGNARMKRWVRANKLGLSPPIEVLAVLLREEKKGTKGIERAYVDELMSSKFVVGDAA
ncbi:DNA polymerase delta [Diplocarpon rosae]|nr:DNA polymerase delta [Diplocarpon rosae]